jgi:hypothetical protein
VNELKRRLEKRTGAFDTAGHSFLPTIKRMNSGNQEILVW